MLQSERHATEGYSPVPASPGLSVATYAADEAPCAETFLPSPEEVQREVAIVRDKSLSTGLARWVEAYTEFGTRDPYLWTWCRQAVEVTTLPCVTAELRDELCDTKALGVMFDVLLDDLADQGGDEDLLEELLKLPVGRSAPVLAQFSPSEQSYGRFASEVWRAITERAEAYPCFDEYADVLRYDYLQLCNVMRYSYLLNTYPTLLNLTEHDLYTPHNMHIMICCTFDLMCSPQFNRSELGRLREVIWHAQCMGRIGNLVTTWQREIDEGDFTSGVFARAVSCGDLTVSDLHTDNRESIKAAIEAGGHETYFLNRWHQHRCTLLSESSAFQSFDIAELVAGFERLIGLHLGSRGHK